VATIAVVNAIYWRMSVIREHVRRLEARPDWPLVSGLALTLTGLLEAYAYAAGDQRALTLFLALLTTLPLTFRQTHLATAATTITFATLALLAGPETPETASGIAAQVWILYLVGERYRGWIALVVGTLLAFTAFAGNDPALSSVLLVGLATAALAVGNSHRLGGQVVAEREAARRDQAVLEERARIARELHDVVAHHVSSISIQADTARLTTPGMPEAGAERLAAIGDTAREAMAEMRRVLGVLRTDGDGGRDPQPDLDGLDALIETARAAGTPVRLVRTGQAGPLAPGVELTAYRIVQEALTNARRHAPGAMVDVELRFTGDGLRLRVRDDGPGPPAKKAHGHGLVGMRERVAMVGGTLQAGPATEGGFAVEVELPGR
jgi:signal transduction histidine kinase